MDNNTGHGWMPIENKAGYCSTCTWLTLQAPLYLHVYGQAKDEMT